MESKQVKDELQVKDPNQEASEATKLLEKEEDKSGSAAASSEEELKKRLIPITDAPRPVGTDTQGVKHDVNEVLHKDGSALEQVKAKAEAGLYAKPEAEDPRAEKKAASENSEESATLHQADK